MVNFKKISISSISALFYLITLGCSSNLSYLSMKVEPLDTTSNYDTFLVLGGAGSGKTSLINKILRHKFPNEPNACCSTRELTINTSDTEKLTLIDGPAIDCAKECFYESLEKKDIISNSKLKGVIVILKFHNKISNLSRDCSEILQREGLSNLENEKITILVSHKDNAQDSISYEQKMREMFTEEKRPSKIIFYSEDEKSDIQKVRDLLQTGFKDVEPFQVKISRYKGDPVKQKAILDHYRAECKREGSVYYKPNPGII